MRRQGSGSRLRSTAVLALGLGASGCAGQGGGGRERSPADTTRATGTMTSRDWEGRTVGRVEELMAGRFPGVQLLRTPEGISVRIRGTTSITGSNEPLYVIDGMTVQPGPGGALVGLNPADIEKIEVLKDVGSTAAYGVQGANGVVLITTRRPKR